MNITHLLETREDAPEAFELVKQAFDFVMALAYLPSG
jgi:hypothetical protein